MKLPLFTGLLLFLTFNAVIAQEHDHHRHHVGIGFGGTSLFSEGEFAPGLHVHYLYRLAPHSPISVGLGFESILDEHTHNTINGLVNYSILPRLSINAGPGITFAEEGETSHTSLSGHMELLYEFSIGEFHFGPMLGFGFDKEESHASLGIHIGLGF